MRPGFVHAGGVDLGPALGQSLAREGGAADVGDGADGLALGEAVRDLDDLALAVAEHEQIRLAVEEDGAPDRVGPVVEVRDAAQAGLDAADDERNALEGLPHALRVDDHRVIGAPAGLAIRRVGVVRPDAAIRRVAVHHGVHVARRHAEEERGRAQRLEGLGGGPVRLGDDADAKALGFEQASDHGHAEARVVHVGVAGDQDDVAGVPPQRVHLGAGHGQHGRRRQPAGPVLAVGEEVAGDVHGCGGSAGLCGRGARCWRPACRVRTGSRSRRGSRRPPA